MIIEPVTSLDEKIKRFDKSNRLFPMPLSPQLFFAHLKGIEQFASGKVLEIGGSTHFNMGGFFLELGADYTNIRLERSDADHVIQGHFMHYPLNNYDLIISSGVFEEGALDRIIGRFFRDGELLPNKYYLAKLATLTNPGGLNIHATTSARCLFSNEEIEEAGFDLEYRGGPFFGFWDYNITDSSKTSELVVMRKKE